MSDAIPIERIVEGLQARAGELARTLLPGGHREGAEWREARRAQGGLGDSLSVRIAGGREGVWTHGQWRAGDALDLVAYVACRDDKGAAIRWAKAWLGLDGGNPKALALTRRAVEQKPAEDDGADELARQKRAKAIFLSGVAIAGTPVERYLAGRGLDVARLGFPIGALRSVPALWEQFSGRKWPAMVAPIVGAQGSFLAVHRTFLEIRRDGSVGKAPIVDPGGRKAAKQTLGAYAGGAIRLWNGTRVDPKTGEVKYGRRLSEAGDDLCIDLAEGIEDGLTVALADAECRVWVGVSLGAMTRLVLPPTVRRVVYWRQNDAADSPAAATADRVTAHLAQGGRRVIEARPLGMVKDINDMRPGVAEGRDDHGDQRAAG